MESTSSSNDDDEPKICTVFSSTDVGTSSKTIFDTIAFTTSPKKEESSAAVSFSSLSASSLFTDDKKRQSTPKENLTPSSNSKPIEPTPIPSNRAEVGQVEGDLLHTTSLVYDQGPENKEDLQVVQSSSQPTINNITNEFSSMAVSTMVEEDKSANNLVQQPPISTVVTMTAATNPPPSISSSFVSSNIGNNNINDFSSFENETVLPTANILFADTPEVPFPVGTSSLFKNTEPSENDVLKTIKQDNYQHTGPFQPSVASTQLQPPTNSAVMATTALDKPLGGGGDDFFSKPTFSSMHSIYEAWIPSDETRKVLFALTATPLESSSSQFMPGLSDKTKTTLTTPGIVHEDDMMDKVAINMARIFGEAEASRRKILTADSVTQDDNGLRELIKLGCYRSAINLTKRLLTLYGQGPGKSGHFSKHSPHSLQLWYSRISLLVRIREFTIADSEIEAFKDFENPDMYYEFYGDLHGKGRRGSMVPFHFRLVAAEVPQYMRRTNDTFDKLTHILTTVEKIISNVSEGFCEDGNPFRIEKERIKKSLEIWKKREVRVLYSLANAAIFAKDFTGAIHYLLKLMEKDSEHEMQLKSSLGRLFLQFGDISSAQRYFQLAAEMRNAESESEQVDTLVDCGLLAIGQNNYADALTFFTDALKIQPENYMLTNNMAVCLVYLGKVKEALAVMESTVKQNTPQLLQENVILNLSTIYELENSDGSKKNSLLRQISEYKGDGINLASLKMPNLV